MGLEGLQYQTVPVEFTQGIDTRINRKLKVAGKWDTLVNCTHSLDGSLTKRDGHAALVSDARGNGLAQFDDQLLVINGGFCSAITSSVADTMVAVGQIPYLHVRKDSVARATNRHSGLDAAYGAGVELYVWTEYSLALGLTGAWATAIDSATRTTVMPPTLLSATGRHSRVVFVPGDIGAGINDQFLLCWVDGVVGAEKIYGCIYTPATSLSTLQAPAVLTQTIATIGTGMAATHIATYDLAAFGYALGARTAGLGFVQNGAFGFSACCSQIALGAGAPSVVTTATMFTTAQVAPASITGVACGISGGIGAGPGEYLTVYTVSPVDVGGAMEGVAAMSFDSTWSGSTPTRLKAAIAGPTSPSHIVATTYPVSGITTGAVFVDAANLVGSATGTTDIWSIYATAAPPASPLTVVRTASIAKSSYFSRSGVLQGPWISGKPMVTAPSSTGFAFSNSVALPVMMCGNSTADTVTQSGLFFLDGWTGAVCGKALYGRTVVSTESNVPSSPLVAPLPNRTAPTTLQTFVVPALEVLRISIVGGSVATESGVVALRVTPNAPLGLPVAGGATSSDGGAFAPANAQLGRATFIANGMLALYDGTAITEANFNYFPEGLTVTNAAGGGTWAAGDYAFAACYLWVDGQGQRHLSAPSPVFRLTVAANDTLTFKVPTLQLTQRQQVAHLLFGTQANGTTLTLIAATIANNRALAESTTVVTTPPGAGNELLYSQPLQAGTTLPNDAPGPCSTCGVHQGRLWVDLADKPGAYRYSQQVVDGVGLQWSDLLGGQLPSDSGPITGWASMDELVAVLAEQRLHRITGTGPAPSGAQNGYSDPVSVPSDVGCADPRSIVTLPTGVMFRAPKGWHLLTRDLSVKYVGAPVKRFDGDTVSSAVVMGDRQEVRITSTASQIAITGLNAAVLVYSYVSDAWSVFHIESFTSSPTFPNSALRVTDSVWWGQLGRWVTLSCYDGLNVDTPGVYADQPGTNTSAIVVYLGARTSFLHLGALQGFQRVRWIYLTMSAPSTPATNVTLRLDFDDLYASQNPPGAPGTYQTSNILMSGTGYANVAAIDVRHKLRRQKCKSMAVTINEFPVAAGNPGITGLQAMALEIGVKRGTNKLRAEGMVP